MGCNYFSMLVLQLIHVSKGGPGQHIVMFSWCWYGICLIFSFPHNIWGKNADNRDQIISADFCIPVRLGKYS